MRRIQRSKPFPRPEPHLRETPACEDRKAGPSACPRIRSLRHYGRIAGNPNWDRETVHKLRRRLPAAISLTAYRPASRDRHRPRAFENFARTGSGGRPAKRLATEAPLRLWGGLLREGSK